MDELELRIAAAEKAMLAIAPVVDGAAVARAILILRDELETAEGEEREAVLGAIELLDDGARRFDGPAPGLWIRGEG